ncbi:hypothetical protein Pen02_18920 [Plantactinospora endophytica]|uniref:Uncharacterized protein n=1 Tax=Plantactinospora endophytica TaxID=673535 RepID=A0ABQ4DXZ0_9ACTN|nr:hypothetical protein Pen02_18920 [Plantactinospora endophytica]
MVLVGGPGDGRKVRASGPTVVWRACLYERTSGHQQVRGREVPVYGHRSDCCEGDGHGDTDGCE